MAELEVHSVTCPNCHEVFELDSASYYQLASQVRDAEFEKELAARLALMEKEQALAFKAQTQELEFRLQAEQQARQADKQMFDTRLSAARNAFDADKQQIADRAALELQACRDSYEQQLKAKSDEVAFYKDFKARQSTKAIGESLELYCEDQFNQVRAIGFPNAYFEKDNEISRTGSKGDYIYREMDSDGNELLSIMFEMKNESDTTASNQRHKNSDFFKELDKDRREKGCEYAILVTMLESDSELYNQGIVDVSHRHPKMYVIRPQFFIPVIGFLRNAALKALDYRRRIAELEHQNLDVIGFERKLTDFKTGFERNYNLATGQFDAAIAALDKAMDDLAKTKANLMKAQNNMRLAGDKLDSLTIQRLVRGSPYMKELFEQAGT